VDLPNSLHLSKITKKHLYFDKKSKESTTEKINKKYKLAGNSVLGQYFFNILTKSLAACKPGLTLCIKRTDWENKIKGPYLTKPASYCDLTKYEWLDESVLLKKIKDRQNGFPCIAKLCEAKYKELQKLRKRMGKYPHITKETRNIVKRGLTDNIDNLIIKLDLK
jgi:hypothetical protein